MYTPFPLQLHAEFSRDSFTQCERNTNIYSLFAQISNVLQFASLTKKIIISVYWLPINFNMDFYLLFQSRTIAEKTTQSKDKMKHGHVNMFCVALHMNSLIAVVMLELKNSSFHYGQQNAMKADKSFATVKGHVHPLFQRWFLYDKQLICFPRISK